MYMVYGICTWRHKIGVWSKKETLKHHWVYHKIPCDIPQCNHNLTFWLSPFCVVLFCIVLLFWSEQTFALKNNWIRLLLVLKMALGLKCVNKCIYLSFLLQLFIRGQACKGLNPVKIGFIFLYSSAVFRIMAVLSLRCCRFLWNSVIW